MTISLLHDFHSAKGDPADTTLVRPSDWNAEHVIEMATGKVIGRSTSGTGAAEELAAGTAGLSLLASADATALIAALAALGIGGFTTGDAKLTLKTTADSGWVMANDGTIGDASSGASTRANADAAALFAILWNIDPSYAPIFTSAGANSTRGPGDAPSDFALHKRISLTKVLGRAIAIAGAGSALTSRALGQTLGEETHALTSGENAAHTHTGTTNGADRSLDHTHNYTVYSPINTGVAGGPAFTVNGGGSATSGGANSSLDHLHSFTTAGSGSGTPHNIMQPTSFWNVMVKL